jgi:glycosyltransferase involved in cell wall biosynthesis
MVSVGRPVGGVNVLLWLIEKLNEAGYHAAALHGSRSYNYEYRSYTGELLYSRELDNLLRRGFFRRGFLDRVRQALKGVSLMRWRRWFQSPPRLPVWQPEPQDVFVVPEFMYPEAVAAFGANRCILAVQGFSVLLVANLRSQHGKGRQPEQFNAIFSTSQACAGAVRAVFNVEGGGFPLPVCHAGLSYNPDKKLQIALMPRKRREEARILATLIERHPDLIGVPLVVIDQLPDEVAHRLIRESLIFLSLSEREGFGLPPAEAMATGCLVIGYTGVGGEEFFTRETGFPIPDGDIVAFVEEIARVVSAWRQAPEALERKRRHASDFIWSRYNETVAQQSLLDLWTAIDAHQRVKDQSRWYL